MTLTTAVRIESILEGHLHLIPLMVGVDNDSADIGGMTAASQAIAAEIDGLRNELTVILRERNDAHMALAERTRERDEARDMLATITPAWINDDVRPETLVETCQRQAAEIDGLRDELTVILRERNDAQLALAERTRERDEAHNETQKLRWLLQKAQAEVERLRLAADAQEP